ncbi:hypothetical protein HQ545_08080 [Candidatus Woesearchaeota archaeon]|nr:hypothetical protein [Candidatus Woesearchaeota archaeon]
MKSKIILAICLMIIGLMTLVSAEGASMSKENVKCVFMGSDEEHKCYSAEGHSCTGTESCTVIVSGEHGKKLTWKSSCGGYATTVVDGVEEKAEFECAQVIEAVTETVAQQVVDSVQVVPAPTVKENVKCVFIDSDKEQKCYSKGGHSCTGVESCIAITSGAKGSAMMWKSSCGGYAKTLMDGTEEKAEFKCGSELEVTEEEIRGTGFRFASWQCFDGKRDKQGSQTTCVSSDVWKKKAEAICSGHCNELVCKAGTKCYNKCGVNYFSVAIECYVEDEAEAQVVAAEQVKPEEVTGEEQKPTEPAEEYMGEEQEEAIEPIEEEIDEEQEEMLICKDSCPLEDKCYPFGYRKSGMFCLDEGMFVDQQVEDSTCDNNFECTSNVCVDQNCVSSNFIQKIISWFNRLFG